MFVTGHKEITLQQVMWSVLARIALWSSQPSNIEWWIVVTEAQKDFASSLQLVPFPY